MKTLFNSLPSSSLVLLFAYAAATKLNDFAVFKNQMHHQAFPAGAADVLVYLLPAAEIISVFLLLSRRLQLAGLQLCLSLLIVFTGYIILVLLHWWAQTPCSCGGILTHLSWGGHLLFNCVFIILNVIAIHIYFRQNSSGVCIDL